MNRRLIIITGLILLAVISRFLPHPPNFTPVAAIALFSGAYLRNKKLAFLIPLSAMFLSDLVIGMHSTIIFVYIGFALIVVMGFALNNNISFGSLIVAGLASAIVFFVLTNFGAWFTMSPHLYSHSWSGFVSAYVSAIPFFRYTLLGNLVYVIALFGLFEFATKQISVLQR